MLCQHRPARLPRLHASFAGPVIAKSMKAKWYHFIYIYLYICVYIYLSSVYIYIYIPFAELVYMVCAWLLTESLLCHQELKVGFAQTYPTFPQCHLPTPLPSTPQEPWLGDPIHHSGALPKATTDAVSSDSSTATSPPEALHSLEESFAFK